MRKIDELVFLDKSVNDWYDIVKTFEGRVIILKLWQITLFL